MNINTAANFMLVAFIKINRLSSFFSEICRPKFSKLFREAKNKLSARVTASMSSTDVIENGRKATALVLVWKQK